MPENPYETFTEEAPQVAEAYHKLVDTLIETTHLDLKTKQLILIAIKAASGDMQSLQHNISLAKDLGASRDEIKDTLLLTIISCGLKGMTSYLPMALEAYDRAGDSQSDS